MNDDRFFELGQPVLYAPDVAFSLFVVIPVVVFVIFYFRLSRWFLLIPGLLVAIIAFLAVTETLADVHYARTWGTQVDLDLKWWQSDHLFQTIVSAGVGITIGGVISWAIWCVASRKKERARVQ